MSRVENMQKETESNSEKFREFMRIIRDNKFPVLFEGEDVKYFDSRLKSYLNKKDWAHIDCGGKEKLLELREEIKKNKDYKDKKAIYFVDADFDDNTSLNGQEDIYITPCYAIENFYIKDEVFEQILSKQFKLSPYGDKKDLYQKILLSFRKSKAEFFNFIEEFNQYVYLIKSQKENISYQGIKTTDIVKIGLESSTKNYNCINDIFHELDVGKYNLRDAQDFFSEKDKEMTFRGKNIIEFLKIYLINLRLDKVQNKKPSESRVFFDKKGNLDFNITDNILSEISSYAFTPDCLIEFLNKHNN